MLPVIFEANRQKILRLAWERELSAGQIAAQFDSTFGAVSQHLRVLRENGFLDVRKSGRERYYRANKEALGGMAAALEQFWGQQPRDLKALAGAAERKRRKN